MNQQLPAPLVTVSTILADSGAYGLVWIDTAFDVTAKYGSLVHDIEICTPLAEAIPALFGYEDDIKALAGQPGKLFVLPNISMHTCRTEKPEQKTPRLNITAFWSQAEDQFILLLARASTGSHTEIEISHQMRKRLMAEEALAQKSRELEIANQDLEEYAEIIAHDLSAPLRAIRYLTDDIEKALTQKDADSAKVSLADLRTQSKRMSSMMVALLDYASVGRKNDLIETLDTGLLVQEIINSLPHPKGISVTMKGRWPTVKTMKAPLDLVIRNLIDNAIKHHDKAHGSICIEATNVSSSQNFLFKIQDDGPGIDPKHHTAVMLPFRTINSDPKGHSRGMGLALVKRTVETAGGTLELHSDPSQKRGTEISVIWPANTKPSS